jgi:DNA adenine methylase
LARRIVALLPAHRTNIEPYAGGLSVLLNKEPAEIEAAGDLNGPLIEFYMVLRDRSEDLILRLQSIAYTRENFEWACQESEDQDPLDRAVRFLVRNRFSRGGLGRDFAWSERKRGGQPGDVNGWQTIVEQLPAIARRLAGIKFYHADALDLIQKYDGPDTLFYLDPPYLPETRTARKTYDFEMSYEDHERLLDTLLKVQGMVVLSGYHSALYDAALRSWERHEFNMANHSGQGKSKQRRIEVVWLNPACDRFKLRG